MWLQNSINRMVGSGMTRQCPVCKTEFECGAEQAAGSCWCAVLPPVLTVDPTQDCLCRACLLRAIEDRIDLELKLNGVAAMVQLASRYRGQTELIDGLDYRIENGDTVFSKWYHLKRGSCCDNDCRNCPDGTV
jgi:hypothetical protein